MLHLKAAATRMYSTLSSELYHKCQKIIDAESVYTWSKLWPDIKRQADIIITFILLVIACYNVYDIILLAFLNLLHSHCSCQLLIKSIPGFNLQFLSFKAIFILLIFALPSRGIEHFLSMLQCMVWVLEQIIYQI